MRLCESGPTQVAQLRAVRAIWHTVAVASIPGRYRRPCSQKPTEPALRQSFPPEKQPLRCVRLAKVDIHQRNELKP
jgi:hypothetical protein